jgi:putative membrane protein
MLGGAGAAAAGAALAAGILDLPSGTALHAAAAGLASALALPGLGLERFRRRSFSAGFAAGASGVRLAEAALPARFASRRPSELVDAADRLRLEAAIAKAQEQSGAELALALVRRAGRYEAARGRLATWSAALVFAGAVACAPSGPLAAGALAALAGFTALALARAPRLLRFASREAELAANAGRAAGDAFVRLGLSRSPGHGGVLVFAAFLEGRVIVLGDPGAPRAHQSGADWSRLAAAVAAGLAERPAEGLLAAVEAAGALAARERPPGPRSPVPRPLPVAIEDDGLS